MLQTLSPSTELEVIDYHLATILHAAGARLRGLRFDSSNNSCIFLFADNDGAASRLRDKHFDEGLLLDSGVIMDSMAAVKNKLFTFRREMGVR